jgi:hypothetical protein
MFELNLLPSAPMGFKQFLPYLFPIGFVFAMLMEEADS